MERSGLDNVGAKRLSVAQLFLQLVLRAGVASDKIYNAEAEN